VDVPLPLGFDRPDPVVLFGSALGLVVLAAGSPVVEPRPLGLPCARVGEELKSIQLKIIKVAFMVIALLLM
jgi:hypothetical protein